MKYYEVLFITSGQPTLSNN